MNKKYLILFFIIILIVVVIVLYMTTGNKKIEIINEIEDVSQKELKDILGNGDVTLVLTIK